MSYQRGTSSTGGGVKIKYLSSILKNRDGIDGATALRKEFGLLVDKLIKQAVLDTVLLLPRHFIRGNIQKSIERIFKKFRGY